MQYPEEWGRLGSLGAVPESPCGAEACSQAACPRLVQQSSWEGVRRRSTLLSLSQTAFWPSFSHSVVRVLLPASS